MGSLLAMIYHCAQGAGGAIEAAFAGAVTQAECRDLLDFMSRNEIGSLLEQGVPVEATLAPSARLDR